LPVSRVVFPLQFLDDFHFDRFRARFRIAVSAPAGSTPPNAIN
jgi:hypothetical protein